MRPQRKSFVEYLESRMLLSGWASVDTLHNASISGMAADTSDDVYAVGSLDANGVSYGIVREKPRGSPDAPGSWVTIAETGPNEGFNAVAVDKNGDVFVGGEGAGTLGTDDWLVWELPAGAGPNGLKVVDEVAGAPRAASNVYGLAVDAGGNVFATGTVADGIASYCTTRKGLYDDSTGTWTFTTIDSVAGQGAGVTVISSGPSSGVYAVGSTPGSVLPSSIWLVRKSSDGGTTWSTVDSFAAPDNLGTPGEVDAALAVTADPAGNLYVAGESGGVMDSRGFHWVVRKSLDGGTSWSTDDDFPQGNRATAIGSDASGNIFVAGFAPDASGNQHAIVRSNVGGSWNTVDDYVSGNGPNPESYNYALTVDSAGNAYAGGGDLDSNWFIRSSPGPTAKVTLNFSYLVILAQHYNGPGTFTTGDLNGDGQVNFADLVLLAGNYGKTVSPTDFAPATAAPSGSSTVFSPAPVTSATDETDTLHRARHRR